MNRVAGFIALLVMLTSSLLSQRTKQVSVPDMVLITGGEFSMGQADGEGDERPVHKVMLSDFYLGKYEVTVAEHPLFCQDTKREMPPAPKWGWVDNHPIVNTTWYDAQAYVEWLNSKLSKAFRLPTKAEFEYDIGNGGKTGTFP